MVKLYSLLVILFLSINVYAQNGIMKTYHASGKVASRLSFVDDVMEGTSFWYYENGNIKTEKNYSGGKLNGIVRNFFSNGLIKDETHLVNGVLHGIIREYYENGSLKSVKNYDQGKLISSNNVDFDTNYIAPLSAYNAGKRKKNLENNDFICELEICPEPVGGIEEIEKNIIYPELAKQYNLEGSVLVSTFIDDKGIPNNIEILQGLGLGCDEAAIDAIKRTTFIPGRNNDEEFGTVVTFRLNFVLKNNENETEKNLDKTPNVIEEITEVAPKNFISCNIEKCPEPIGGIVSLLDILRYPPQAKRNNISGEVILSAKVNDIGFVISAEVIEGLGYGCDEAAKSAIIKTQFEPGKIADKAVDSSIEIVVPFILDETN